MKKTKFFKQLTWLMQDTGLLGVLALSRRLSWSAGQKLGAWLGAAAYRLAPRRRRVALANLSACFPNLSAAERRRLARANFREIGKLYLELGHIWQTDPATLPRLIRQVDCPASVKRTMEKDGVVYALLHQGCWELCGMPLPDKNRRYTMYKPNPHLPKTDQRIQQGRHHALNAAILPANRRSIRALLRALKNGDDLFILGDIVPDLSSGAVTAPFFGIPARTGTLIGKLAQRAPVVFAQALRLNDGYRVSYFDAPAALYDKDPAVSAAALNLMFEQLIRSCPEQYLWTYKRFRRSSATVIYK